MAEWISVDERLPDLIPCNAGTAYSETVFVWTSGRKAMAAVWDGEYFLCAADYWEAWGEDITHWMPCRPPGEDVLAAPAVDAVQVVRCKDCAVPNNKWTGCPKMNGTIMPPDGFCSYGERRG